MSTSRRRAWLLLAGALALPSVAPAGNFVVGLGRPVAEAELRPWSTTVFPDGRNLPPGRGTAREGADFFHRKGCGDCHGKTGIEGPASRLAGSDGFFELGDPLRILRIRKHPVLIMSTGAQWPHATSIFDYVRRAMPHAAPKSLTNDEVYALTAYILHLNGLIGEEDVLDRENLPGIEMPGRSRSVSLWPNE